MDGQKAQYDIEKHGGGRIILRTVLLTSVNFVKERKREKTNKGRYIELDKFSLTLKRV